jgi:hypothetical protein
MQNKSEGAPARMRVLFTKLSDERHAMEIVRADGTGERVELRSREFLFHDLLHYAVESALGTEGGFWGALAAGKTLADLNDRTGEAMGELAFGVAGVEPVIGMMTGVVKSNETAAEVLKPVRGYIEALGQEPPAWCSTEFIDDVRERMRRLLGRWNAVPYRATMEIPWPAASQTAPPSHL